MPHTSCIALIDIGNTRIKAGWINLGSQTRSHPVLALPHNDLDSLLPWYKYHQKHVVAALGVSVAATPLTNRLNHLFESECKLAIQWVSSQAHTLNVSNEYDQPETLGADRWVAMLGLAGLPRMQQPLPRMLVNFGTATTIDTLWPWSASSNPDGWIFKGGLILPGSNLMRTALSKGTAQLPYASAPACTFPSNTQSAIASGIMAAQVGAVIYQWQEIALPSGTAAQIYATGGGWDEIANTLQTRLLQTQQRLNLPQQAIIPLTAPILDGLARLALSAYS